MRKTAAPLFYLFLCLISFTTYAQQDKIKEDTLNIDPRQYVTVKYRKTPTQGRSDTLWNWDTRLNVPNQKIHYVDIDGEIRIDFLKTELIDNKYFEGTFSLQADISGADGTRKIEVNPYSEIGVARVPIGIKSEPPAEIAKKLLNMLKELKDAERAYKWVTGSELTYQRLNDALKYSQTTVNTVLEYLKSFEDAGEDATKAFLALINKDLIGYASLKNNLSSFQRKLEKVNIDQAPDLASRDTILEHNKELIIESSKYLFELSKVEGSPLEEIIQAFSANSDVTEKFVRPNVRDQEYKETFFKIIDQYRDKLAAILSREAGKLIYKKLVYATIDLGKSGAKSGEVLNIYITWILDSKKDNSDNSPRLPIGKYYLRETGWKMEVADMFAMVKRIGEQKADPATLSPSNFKGSGGAVLMWTFNKEDRGVRISQDSRGRYVVARKNKFLNFLEPSIGLNVSYLDFSTDKDVEIGTGLQLGIFRNKIFFGYGLNLHMLSPKGQSPKYYYIGFSFARLSDLFKNSNSVNVSK